mgnify:FL=1
MKYNKAKQAVFPLTVAVLLFHTSVWAAPLSLSLQDSVQLALQNNPAIRIAVSDQEKSEWGVNEAQAGKLPALSLGSSYNLKQAGSASNGNDLNNSLRLGWQLYSGGRVEGQIDQAKQNAAIASLGIDKAKTQVKLDAMTAYFTVLQTGNLVEVNRQTVANLDEHLNSIQAKYDAGVVAKADVLRSEVELANARQNLIKAENNFDLAKNSLLNTMMLDAGTELALTETLQYAPYERTLDECLTLAEKNRPDIAQADAAVTMAATGIDLAKSGRLPSVSLSASNGWSEGVLPGSDNWSVGVSASWNLFDAGVTGAKVKQADASLTKAQEQARQTKTGGLLEVRQNYLSMAEAQKRLDTNAVSVSKAEEDLYIAKERYNAGVGTNLDVIDAQLALTQAKTNRIQSLYDYNVNVAKLDKAIGVKAE